VFASVSNLLPNALYHMQLVAINSSGTSLGPDQKFTTGKDPAPGRPALGKNVNVKPISGLVLIKPPKGKSLGTVLRGVAVAHAAVVQGKGFVPLTEARQIPTGSQIDARQGTLQMTQAPAKKHAKTQSGNFGGAIFKVTQSRKGSSKGLSTLSLLEGNFRGAPTYASCKKRRSAHIATAGPSAVAARLSKKVLQTLKGNAHGRFRTRGRYSASTVRGTKWNTSDRCDGTLTVVTRDVVSVTDFTRHRTVLVHAGHRYLAPAKKGK
jgi:hypothetical protein